MTHTTKKDLKLTPAQQQLVTENLGLAYQLISRTRHLNLSQCERESAALYGLCIAAAKFDPALGYKFSTLAHRIMVRRIYDDANKKRATTSDVYTSDAWVEDRHEQDRENQDECRHLRQRIGSDNMQLLWRRHVDGSTLSVFAAEQECTTENVRQKLVRLHKICRKHLA